MSNKEQIDYLLLDIRELENLVASLREDNEWPMRLLADSNKQALKIVEILNRLESEHIQHIGTHMAEQEKEMTRLSLLLESYQHSAKKHEADIQKMKEQESSHEAQPLAEVTVEPMTEPLLEPIATSVPITQQQPAKPAPSIPIETAGLSLNEILEKKNLSDFRKAFSLNDRFHFRRELFAGDESRMNKAIADLNAIHSYEESVTYLNNELKWNVEDVAVADFIKLLEKRFL